MSLLSSGLNTASLGMKYETLVDTGTSQQSIGIGVFPYECIFIIVHSKLLNTDVNIFDCILKTVSTKNSRQSESSEYLDHPSPLARRLACHTSIQHAPL